MIEALKAFVELVSKLPAASLKVLGVLGLTALGYFAYAHGARLDALDIQGVRVEEQRRSEVQAIRDLTDEVRSYRQAVLDAARGKR